eukprot:gene5262-17583_t
MLGNDGEKYVCCVGSRCTLILANNTGYDCAAMNGTRYLDESSEEIPFGTTLWWEYAGICVALVLMAGIFSGLTLGLLSLDTMQLSILQKAGHDNEQKYAKTLIPLVKQHHLLLVTLLLANAGVAETLPLFLDRLVPSPIYAVIISVTAVLIFGEVIPQALCSKHGLAIGHYMSPFVYLMMGVLFVIGWPLAKMLDCLLGHESGAYFRRTELSELVQFHMDATGENEDPLNEDEARFLQGVLCLREKKVEDVMTNLEKVFMLPKSGKLDKSLMTAIINEGHSRVPVYTTGKEDCQKFMLVKDLIMLNPDDGSLVENAPSMRPLFKLSADASLFEAIDYFQEGVVRDRKLIGIVTLEDAIEELIQEEIVDETDVYEDVDRGLLRKQARATLFRRFSRHVGADDAFLSGSLNSGISIGGGGGGGAGGSVSRSGSFAIRRGDSTASYTSQGSLARSQIQFPEGSIKRKISSENAPLLP